MADPNSPAPQGAGGYGTVIDNMISGDGKGEDQINPKVPEPVEKYQVPDEVPAEKDLLKGGK